MAQNTPKTTLTTIGINQKTNKLIEKLSKRFDLKKGEIVQLAFEYMDKASINPSEPPESTKAEMGKIIKRMDDVIRFIRHFEEKELNPMVRASHSIASRFDETTANLIKHINTDRQQSKNAIGDIALQFGEAINKQAEFIQHLGKKMEIISQTNKRLLKIQYLFMELEFCSITEVKKKEKLKDEIQNLIKPTENAH